MFLCKSMLILKKDKVIIDKITSSDHIDTDKECLVSIIVLSLYD